MLRTNGGLIGSRRQPSLSAAPGVWSLAEQATNARQALWPGQSPVPGLSPVNWYDFADTSKITLSGSQIASIADKGTRAWDLDRSTSSGPLLASSGINGLPSANWGSAGHSNLLRNTSTTSTSLAEIYVVIDADFGSTFPNYNGLITVTGASASPALIANSGSTGFTNTNGWTATFINNSGTSTHTSSVLPSINSPCLLRINRTDNAANTTTTGIQLGMNRATSGTGWSGLMGEVIVFSSQLSSGDRSAVQTYLAKKWGLTLS